MIVAPSTRAMALLAQPRAVGEQSALRVGGPHAERIGGLWNVLLWVGLAATVITFALLAYAIVRRRRPEELPPEADRPADPRGELANDESGGRGHAVSGHAMRGHAMRGHAGRGRPESERTGAHWMVIGGIAFPSVILLVVLVQTLRTLAAVSAPADSRASIDLRLAPGELAVEVVGRQYWWEVKYLDSLPARVFETANELRIPVGRRVLLRLRSADVIHSFWVPGLQGKMDLIPGRVNVLTLQADRPGVWRGQCAEFCGVQHGKMALTVVAEPPARFAAWQASQRAVAATPSDTTTLADQRAFLASGCTLCHAVRGTDARGELGPDLTHVGSRLTLAAGTLPNTPGNLYGWIADPQAHKPGNKMPPLPLASAQLHAITRYLLTLR